VVYVGGEEAREKEAFKYSVLKALANPTRRKILSLTSERHCHPDELAKELKVTRPTVEGHLAELENAKLIQRVTDPVTGKVFINITPAGRTLHLAVDGLLEDYYVGRVREAGAPTPPAAAPPVPTLPKPEKNIWGRFLEGLANSIKRRPAEWISFILFLIGIVAGQYGYSRGLYLGGTMFYLFSFLGVPLLYVFVIRPLVKAARKALE